MVLAPVEVTVPYQSSTSLPTDPWNCPAFFHVVTPPPDIDDTDRVWPMIPTTITSPVVLGDTARVVSAVPFAEARLPTAVMTLAGTVKVNWSVAGLTGLVPPGVVTVTSTVPADSAGEVTVSEVPAPFTTTLVPAVVPNFTEVAPVKPDPVTVTEVPPDVGPVFGLTAVTAGTGGAVKVNWSADGLTGLVPPGAVTVTSTVPADSAGEVTVSEVPVPFTTTLVPAVVPNFTEVAPVKPDPVTVTEVPPDVGPVFGLTAVTAGTGGAVKVNWSVDGLTGLVPPGAVTVTSTVPADSAGEVTVSEVPAPFTTTLVPAVVPNFTEVAPVKPDPVTVTEVPPDVGPVFGLTAVTAGTGGAVKVNWSVDGL